MARLWLLVIKDWSSLELLTKVVNYSRVLTSKCNLLLSTVSTTPTHLELVQHVIPQYAADWWNIGLVLGLTDAKLRTIRMDNPHSVEGCCYEMFAEWLKVDTTASWKKLFTAIGE